MTPRAPNACGHCGRAGHYRPTCPEYDPALHTATTRRVREAMERTPAREVVTDPRTWGMW